MKIQQSNVSMMSQHLIAERYEVQESLRFWVGDGDPSTNEAVQDRPLLQIQDQVNLSSSCRSEENTGNGRTDPPIGGNAKYEVIRLLLERLTGRKIQILKMDNLEPASRGGEREAGKPNGSTGAEESAGFGLAYERHETYSETETVRFVSSGLVLTEEGREIRFELQFGMDHVFSTTEHASIRLGDARKMDPLVVDLDGQAAILTEATFSFDINSDGVEEKLAALGPAKGFLVLDKNGDGRITDGSELFGPQSGDGFLELAGLDKDGNGWVDENEPDFKNLGVWRKDPQKNEGFLSMSESGIGAIYTGRIATPFSLNDAGNELQGELKETGLYLKENGRAALIQELDLVI